MMRAVRKVIDNAMPFVGVAVILSATLFLRGDLYIQIAAVGLGMLLIEVGVWKLGHRFLPDERRYVALRAESDRFLALVRRLNAAALALKEHNSPENRRAFEQIQEAMRQAVGRMAHVAGRTNAELASEREVPA